jgi:hypothetical protein
MQAIGIYSRVGGHIQELPFPFRARPHAVLDGTRRSGAHMEVQRMKRWKRGAVCGAVSVLALALAGCEMTWVNVMIPDFQSKQVQGVWIWLSPGATGAFAHDMQVPVSPQIVSPPTSGTRTGEWQTVSDSSGQQQVTFLMAQPDPANPDGITVMIGLGVGTISGYVRVSTYNVVGESPLSQAATAL